jgi:hypothetical protein
VQQDTIPMPHAAFCERAGGTLDPHSKLGPGPHAFAPDNRRPIRKPPRGLQQQMREVAGWDQRTASRIDT